MRTIVKAALAALLAAASAAWTPPAHAEPTPPDPKWMDHEQAYAERLIKDSGAARYFAVRTVSNVAELVHVPSGMTCFVASETPDNRIIVYDRGLPRGQDVACARTIQGLAELTFARKLPAGRTADEALSSLLAEARSEWPDLEPDPSIGPARGEQVVGEREHPPRVLIARSRAHSGGQAVFVQFRAMVVDGWLIGFRTAGPLAKAFDGEMSADWAMKFEVWDRSPR